MSAEANLRSLQTEFVARCSKENASPAQKATLEEYRSLSLRDPLKRVIIAKFEKDKSCGWNVSWKESNVNRTEKFHESERGWLPDFMVASKLKLDVNDGVCKVCE